MKVWHVVGIVLGVVLADKVIGVTGKIAKTVNPNYVPS